MIVQCATFSKSLNPPNINKSVSDIRIRIRFPFQRRFWIFVSGCKLTILPYIQLANQIVIISAVHQRWARIRTGSDCNLLKIGGSGLDRTEKYFVVSMREHIKILAEIQFYRFAK